MWVSSASRPRAAVGVASPCGGVSRVVGKAGDGDACGLVRCVAEPDVAGLAGCLGYRRGAAHGGDLLGVLAPLQQRSYLGDQRGETHRATRGSVLSNAALGCMARVAANWRSMPVISAFSKRIWARLERTIVSSTVSAIGSALAGAVRSRLTNSAGDLPPR